MNRTMYDGINSDASVIPITAELVAGYVDGLYAWTQADWDRFPHSIHVGIAVHQTTDAGDVLDVENGNASPAESVGWVEMRRRAGADPSVYMSLDVWPQVQAAFRSAGVPEPHYWVAHYDGVQEIPAGAVAKQYQNGPSWDLSVVADYWPGVDPTPVHSDAHVVVLQELLNADGEHLVVDGVKGPLTKEAFTAALGRVGTLVEGSSGLPVKILQAMLNTWWSILPLVSVDGDFGPLTEDDVQRFQVARNVPNSVVNGHGDGQVGPATKAALAV